MERGGSRPRNASMAAIKLRNMMPEKSEDRNPKAERNPKPEGNGTACRLGFGFRISFGFRPSDFGFFFMRWIEISLSLY